MCATDVVSTVMCASADDHEKPRSPGGSQAGYTMLETMMVVTIGAILFGFAAMSARSTIPQLKADAAVHTVRMQLMLARERAQTERRVMEVRFMGRDRIRLRRRNTNNRWELLNDVMLEGGVQFRKFGRVPDTPDAFGGRGPVALDGGGRRLFCRADGMFVDQNGVPINGTIFLGRQREVSSARALTLFGATGRLTSYTWTADGWRR